MRSGRALALGVLLVALAPFAHAQQEDIHMAPPPPAEDAALDARAGTWQGTGVMMGMQVSETLHASWILGHQFFVSHSTMTMTMPDGQQMPMEMQMTMKPNGDNTYSGVYMDSWGMMGDFTARIDEAGNMITEWADPGDGMSHRAVETPTTDGWTMQYMSQQPDGSWVESGAMIYTRAAQ
jgi:hypothetical protein